MLRDNQLLLQQLFVVFRFTVVAVLQFFVCTCHSKLRVFTVAVLLRKQHTCSKPAQASNLWATRVYHCLTFLGFLRWKLVVLEISLNTFTAEWVTGVSHLMFMLSSKEYRIARWSRETAQIFQRACKKPTCFVASSISRWIQEVGFRVTTCVLSRCTKKSERWTDIGSILF